MKIGVTPDFAGLVSPISSGPLTVDKAAESIRKKKLDSPRTCRYEQKKRIGRSWTREKGRANPENCPYQRTFETAEVGTGAIAASVLAPVPAHGPHRPTCSWTNLIEKEGKCAESTSRRENSKANQIRLRWCPNAASTTTTFGQKSPMSTSP